MKVIHHFAFSHFTIISNNKSFLIIKTPLIREFPDRDVFSTLLLRVNHKNLLFVSFIRLHPGESQTHRGDFYVPTLPRAVNDVNKAQNIDRVQNVSYLLQSSLICCMRL